MSSYVRFTLVLTLICIGAAGGVGVVYLFTRGPIAQKAYLTECELRSKVLPGSRYFREVSEGSGVFAGRAAEDGPVLGYVAVGEAGGYGGRLQVMVGLDTDLAVTAASVLSHNETPGLGAELTKVQSADTLWTALLGGKHSPTTSWMDRFAHKRKGEVALGSGIDAKTGCTITSRAIVNAARSAIDKAEKALKKGVSMNADTSEERTK